MGMIMPDSPARPPDVNDEQWQKFMSEYHITVLVPLEVHLRERARLVKIILVMLIPSAAIIIAAWCGL
jgi:hypothetical protein